jgi:muconolactone delta-isomerase
MEDLQSCPRRRGKWIRYSALDAKATYDLARALEGQLQRLPCRPALHKGMDPAVAHATGGLPLPSASSSRVLWEGFPCLSGS